MADMTFSEFEERASQTDRFVRQDVSIDDQDERERKALLSALFAMSEKVGATSHIAKQLLRGDRDVSDMRDQEQADIVDAMGDLLWYMACACRHLRIGLAHVAETNLRRADEIYSRAIPEEQDQIALAFIDADYAFLDSKYPEGEQLPRNCTVEFDEVEVDGEDLNRVVMRYLDTGRLVEIGDPLNDNSWREDGYRCHDVFHFAYMAILGWSPVMRALLKRKRRSDSQVDEVEDGGRARDIEEGLTAFIFQWAERHDFFDFGRERLPTELLTTVRAMVRHLEVRDRTENDWDRAIREGLRIFGQIRKRPRGRLHASMQARMLRFDPAPQTMAAAKPGSNRLAAEKAVESA